MIKNVKQGVKYIDLIDEIENKAIMDCVIVSQCLYYNDDGCGLVTDNSSQADFKSDKIIKDNRLDVKTDNKSTPIVTILIFLISIIGGIFGFKNKKKERSNFDINKKH